jgi:monoamine oxidase
MLALSVSKRVSDVNKKSPLAKNTLPASPDRRAILKALGTLPVLATMPRATWAANQNQSDVIVVGAGLSGLNAALMLESQGLSVRVLEGRNRIGGRVQSLRNIPGNPEVGGTAFGPGYARLVEAARTYGVGLIDITPVVPYFYRRELILGDEVIPKDKWPTHAKNPFPEGMRELMPWMYLNMFMAQKNPLQTTDAWLDPANTKFDISLHEWLRSQGLSDAAIQLAYNTNPAHGMSSHDVSALMIMMGAAFSGMQRRLAGSGKVMGYTAAGGNQSIPEAMANALKDEVRLNASVTGVRSTGGGAEVHCADGTVYRAKHVVCSVPCSVLRRVRIDPVFTGAQLRGVHTLESQIVNQLHLVASEPFWESDGLDPNMFTDSLAGMVVAEHKGKTPAEVTSLTVWIRGDDAALMDQMPEDEAIAAVVRDLERLRPAAKGKLKVMGYKSWYRDPFAAGDWAYWQPGQISDFARDLATPNGNIHFCGEHTAVSNRGMEGAMESGERVALEILDA